MKKRDSLDRIADALEWRNYWDWFNAQPQTRDEGTGPPPPPPPPPQNDDPIGGG